MLASLLSGKQVEVLPSITSSSVRDRTREHAEVRKRNGLTRIGERTFRFDTEGFLEGWEISGREEFRRVTRETLYYWMHTRNGDEKLLRPN